MKINNKQKGKFGEDISAIYLELNKVKILDRNYQNHFGELDIIGLKDNILIFVEVKTRFSYKYGEGIESIDFHKKRHLINTAKLYIKINHLEKYQIRFDAIEIDIFNSKKINLRYYNQII